MKMTQYIGILVILFQGKIASAQNFPFLTEGRIKFEKKINVYSLLDDNDSWASDYRKTQPQFRIANFYLDFNNNKTFYKPSDDNSFVSDGLTGLPAQTNTIYTELDKHLFMGKKSVFEKTFFIADNIRRIQWKLTSERRTIVGFECKRANAIILDSIFVVAFYTEQILPMGGPESFSGLPGMILGIALPQEHMTWFATQVFNIKIEQGILKPPAGGISINNFEFKETLLKSLKNKGRLSMAYLKASLL